MDPKNESQKEALFSTQLDRSDIDDTTNMREEGVTCSEPTSSTPSTATNINSIQVVGKKTSKKKNRNREICGTSIKERRQACQKKTASLTKCPICLETIRKLKRQKIPIAHTPCKHTFCHPCIKMWLKKCFLKGKLLSCPVCRQKLPGYENGYFLINWCDVLMHL
ncbi:hypothetical protein CDAR_376971 [Caerostris darwini]|uniref:RING-type domain-containing protein n=1 Tax=Caerostris darwini TaxID=1538125 RepID=A0AAV4PJ09_9ARAC|nr:hypothetical protein CDAR_376971 [Caerostris darwini]